MGVLLKILAFIIAFPAVVFLTLQLLIKFERYLALRAVDAAYQRRRALHEAELEEKRQLARKGVFPPRPEVIAIPEPKPTPDLWSENESGSESGSEVEYGLEAACELLAGSWPGSASEVEAQFEPQLEQLDQFNQFEQLEPQLDQLEQFAQLEPQYDQLKDPFEAPLDQNDELEQLNPFAQFGQLDQLEPQFESEPGSEFDFDVEKYLAAPVPADPFNQPTTSAPADPFLQPDTFVQPDPFAQPDPFTQSTRATAPTRVTAPNAFTQPTQPSQPSQPKSTRGTPLDRHIITNLPLYTPANIARGLSVYVPELNCALSPGSLLLVANKDFYGRLWGHALRMEIERLDARPGTRVHALLMRVREEAWMPCSKQRGEGCPPISRFPRLR